MSNLSHSIMKPGKKLALGLCAFTLFISTTFNNNSYGNAIGVSALTVNQTGSTGGTIQFTITWDKAGKKVLKQFEKINKGLTKKVSTYRLLVMEIICFSLPPIITKQHKNNFKNKNVIGQHNNKISNNYNNKTT